jgi:uncharacterized protein YprB with RNaseH-like and TPR domain
MPQVAKSAADIRAMLEARGVTLPTRPKRQTSGRFPGQTRSTSAPPTPATTEPVTRDKLATFRALQSAVGTAASLEADRAARYRALSGDVRENDEGTFLRQRAAYPLSHAHGNRILSDVLGVSADRFAAMTGDAGIAQFDATRTFFFDTETTSLNTGAGVHVFQIGVAYLWPTDAGWDPDDPDAFPSGAPTHVVVDQYFMRDFGEERAMLAEFDRFCTTRSSVVSFFGKSFDAHRVRDRMAFHGLPFRFPGDVHIDLCHLARALWREKYKSVKLQFLEREILAFVRDDDLPGAECPAAYFRFIRTGETHDVHRIFEHNRLDVLSLIVLMAEIDARVASTDDPFERYALAQVYRRFGDGERNIEALEGTLALLESGGGDDTRRSSFADDALGEELAGKSRWEVSLAYKKAERWDQARALWETLGGGANALSIAPLVELAKHAEHKARDPEGALAYAQRALEIAMREMRAGSDLAQAAVADLRSRIARLERRTARIRRLEGDHPDHGTQGTIG